MNQDDPRVQYCLVIKILRQPAAVFAVRRRASGLVMGQFVNVETPYRYRVLMLCLRVAHRYCENNTFCIVGDDEVGNSILITLSTPLSLLTSALFLATTSRHVLYALLTPICCRSLVSTQLLLPVVSALLPPQSGTLTSCWHSRLFFTTYFPSSS